MDNNNPQYKYKYKFASNKEMPAQNTLSVLKSIITIAVVIFFVYWFVVELADYYPRSTATEGFANEIPQTLIRTPLAANNESPATLDLDILRAHRYYNVQTRNKPFETANNNNDGVAEYKTVKSPLSVLNSLTQEIPTTYMLALLGQIPLPLTVNFPGVTAFTELAEYQPAGKKYNPKTPILVYDRLTRLTPNQLADRVQFPMLSVIFDIIKLNVITAINMQVLAQKQVHKAHPFAEFQVIASENMNIRGDTRQLSLTQNLILHRDYHTHTFNIQTQTTIDISNILLPVVGQVVSLELIGSSIQGETQIAGKPSIPRPFNETARKQSNLTDETPILPGSEIALAQPSSGIDFDKSRRQFMSEAARKLEAANKQTSIRLLESTRNIGSWSDPVNAAAALGQYDALNINDGYKCFTVKPNGTVTLDLNRGMDPITCQSQDPVTGLVGVWDKPCSSNSECPFYKSNKNYTNEFGGCKSSGYCEMPRGIDTGTVGYRKYHKSVENKAECYNCISSGGGSTGLNVRDFNCCEAQKKNARLPSPDYRFVGDESVRNTPDAKRELAQLGLSSN